MKGTMKTAVMTGIGKMAFEERPIPQPKDDEALVKIEYVGVCGSDLHYYESGAIGDYVVKPPFVLGHECGGVVVEVGKNVTNVKPGDRVALEPGKRADTVSSAARAGITCARMWYSSPHRPWTAYFRSMWHTRPRCASRCRRTSARWRAR